jgi:hypothetical protein
MSDSVTGSSDAAIKVYGGIGEQHAGQGNVIAQANPYAAPAAAVLQQGGRRRRGRKSSKKGGQGLTEIAVPALLLTANHLYGRKTASKKLGKRRFSRRRGRSFRRRR